MNSINLSIFTTLTVIVSTGTIIAPNPSVSLLQSYEGQTFTFTGQTSFFTVSTGTVFEFEPDTTSTIQNYTFSNLGTSPVTISTVTFSENGVTAIKSFSTSFPTVLTTGSTGTLALYYTTNEEGTYFNEVTFVLDNADDYTFLTEQRVTRPFVLNYSPTSVITTLTNVGAFYDIEFTFSAVGPVISSFSASIAGSSTYTILDSTYDDASAAVSVRFDSIDFPVGTITTSTASLVVSANGDIVSIPLRTDIVFSSALNQSIGSWSSPLALDNAYVAMSYDIIDGTRYLTIGIGSGGNGSPETIEDGILFLDINDLGIIGGNMLTAYINWLEVYRIEIDNQSTTYSSADYLVKSKDQNDVTQSLGYYFGTGNGQGSIFLIENDGFNNLTVKINQLRDLTGDVSFDRTLSNLQNIFYYYSSSDRIYNLESPFNDNQTHYFVGFNNDGSLVTSIVDHP